MNNSIPYKDISKKERKTFRNFKPFWNEELTNLWKEMVRSRKNYEKFKGERHVQNRLRAEYKDKRNLFDKRLRQEERRYNRGKMLEIESLESQNPNEFWDKVQKLGPRAQKGIPMEVVTEDGEVKTSPEEVLQKWQSEFSKMYSGPVGEVFDQEFYDIKMLEKMLLEDEQNDPLFITNHYLNNEITLSEILRNTKKLKRNKAMGIDCIPNEVLKGKQVGLLFVHLFNSCFDKGIIPNQWRLANVFPIPKNPLDDKRNPMTYRGISLLSTISKVYTSLLNERILNYLETENKLVDEQNGFRKGRSCNDHIFTLTSVIQARLQERHSTFCAFIDMKKAFDFVNRELLFFKLLHNNIDGKMYKSIKALYSKTSSRVQVNDCFTSWFLTTSGVRQGDNLSPTLFAIFLNDLAVELNGLNLGVTIDNEKLTILMYADDIVLLAENKADLQKLLDYVATWCKNWQLVLNDKKSQVVHFRKS